MTHNRKKAIILNNAKQYILKNIIAKFSFGLKISKLYLHMIEYRANPIYSFYETFKKAKAYLDMLNAKAQMEKKLEFKFGYKVFKFF